MARKSLEDQGYDVVDFDLTLEELELGRKYIVGMISNGTAPGLKRDIDKHGENLQLDSWLNFFLLGRGPVGRWFIQKILGCANQGRAVQTVRFVARMPDQQYEELVRDRYEFAYKFSEKWQSSGISALVTPTFPHCAFKAKNAMDMGLMLEYNFLWNVLHYPAGIVPITHVETEEEVFEDPYNDFWTELLKETAKGSTGMPIGVQVISHAYQDEKALGVMQAIANKVGFKESAPKLISAIS